MLIKIFFSFLKIYQICKSMNVISLVFFWIIDIIWNERINKLIFVIEENMGQRILLLQ